MNSLYLAIGAFVFYLVAYHTYGKFIARKLFNVDDKNICPSHELNDSVDYVPTSKQVLFGHHFASIAGTGPIVGPAIAVIWGWVPALLWVLLGSVLMGAIHDFGSLVVSLRKMGRSIGDIAGELINSRVKILFLLIIFFLLLIVIAIFGVIIAAVFSIFPESVIPIWSQIPIAIGLGYLIYKRNIKSKLLAIVAVILMYITVVIGAYFPLPMPSGVPLGPVGLWVVILLTYAYIASILPVQVLLQPRDYINAYQLLVAMGLLALGIIVAQPEIVAPSVRINVAGAPPMLPLLFVVIACGAISGFHSLVSSGTSSKQCDTERNSLFIGFGSMLTEGMLAVFVIIACCAGLAMHLEIDGKILTGTEAFTTHYASWSGVNTNLGTKLHAFVTGSKNMIAAAGIPAQIATTVIGVFIAAFAATTLDSATRIQRYIVSELAVHAKLPALSKKHPATLIAVLSAFLLAFHDGAGQGAMTLWPLFGSLNQLLAGLALLVITIYLAKNRKPVIYTALPMVFMIIMTGWAMIINLEAFWIAKNVILIILSLLIMFFELWMIVESVIILRKTYLTGKSNDSNNAAEAV
ncbi:MAG: carbon starvation protein A [Victivallales bacterium]|nr:carbon starvation protein A [Victivallales bacterium]